MSIFQTENEYQISRIDKILKKQEAKIEEQEKQIKELTFELHNHKKSIIDLNERLLEQSLLVSVFCSSKS